MYSVLCINVIVIHHYNLEPVLYMILELHHIFVAFLTVRLVLDSDSLEQKLLDGTPSLFNVSGLSDFSRSLYTHLLISS